MFIEYLRAYVDEVSILVSSEQTRYVWAMFHVIWMIIRMELARIAVYAVPIFEDGSDKRRQLEFCSATYSLDTFSEKLLKYRLKGAGYSLVQENGDVVVDSQHSESFKNFKMFMRPC